MNKIELLPGEEICPVCNGKGENSNPNTHFGFFCYMCEGSGKLDWVSKAMGREPTTKITIPKLRKLYPQLLAKDLVSVQPMDKVFKKNE